MTATGSFTPLQPSTADALFQQAIAHLNAGRLNDADALCQKAVAQNPAHGEAYHLLGVIAFQEQNFEKAAGWIGKAIAQNPDVAHYHANLGIALEKLGRREDAVASFGRAIALDPARADTYFNRAKVLHDLRQPEAALADYDTVLRLSPGDVDAHFNRGMALSALERYDAARDSYLRALELDPNRASTKRALYLLQFTQIKDPQLVQKLTDEILRESINRTRAAFLADKKISALRAHHDLEQTAYILTQNPGADAVARAHAQLTRICARQAAASGSEIALSDEEARDVAAYWDLILRYEPRADIGECLNPGNDWRAIEDAYFASSPEVVQIDNLLAPRALEEMRRFCLLSTVWRKEYAGRYLGALADAGFASALHMRIAQELREKMPRIFGPHPFEHLWAFKCTTAQDTGLNVHADFAKVNLNFWVTEDEANLDPTCGGLVVYDVPAPLSWQFAEYNQSKPETIYAFLKSHNASRRAFTYKCNRAVLFNSRLFHETDRLHFGDSYTQRRINITYLFGQG